MSHSDNNPFSYSYHNNHVADDSSTVYDADTIIPDEVPSSPAMPPLPTLTATATITDYHQQQPNNNNETISSSPYSSQEESPANTISELLRRIKSQHHPNVPSTITITTATTTRSEEIEISTDQSSSSSSKKRSIISNSSSDSSRKKTRQSSCLRRQQPQDRNCTDDKSDSEVGVEDYEPDEAVINQSSSSSQTSTTKELTKHELKWKSKFEELCAFKQLHGHTYVPQRNKQLGQWVQTQRKEYRKFKKNGKGKITPERIQTLESIDFEWVSQNQSQRNESTWNKHFNELKAYKEEYNDTNVPTRWEDNKQLGLWVKSQRTEYKKFQANKKAYITKERIQTLESIGFQWVIRKESAWNERFNELKAYKEKNGRTNESTSWGDNKQLSIWLKNQRAEYRKLKDNKHSCMTNERIQMLESIGFEWVVSKKYPRKESAWNKRFNELKEYKEKYGRTDVPHRWEDNKQLGKWVSTQRTQYKKFQENRCSPITLERINLLNSIGFQWECRPGPAPRS